MNRARRAAGLFLASVAGVGLAACGSGGSGGSGAVSTSTAGSRASAWVDEPVTFESGGMTIYATYRHPANDPKSFPAVLLIAGSGPTDRNGNSTLEPGPVDTLQQLAYWLSDDGVASLRYDKLGSGQTGLGAYGSDPASIGLGVFESEAASALEFLAAQRGVDASRMGVFGHSEGALFALLLATGAAGQVPPVHALGLIEPLSERYLTIISIQITAQVDAQVKSGKISASVGARVKQALASAVASLRSTGHVQPALAYGLGNVLNPDTALFLHEADLYDPGTLASQLAPGTPVLLTCSNADIQVSCGEVEHIAEGLAKAGAVADFVHLVGVDHVLKVDSSMTGADYAEPLPFSPQLRSAIASFVSEYLVR